MSIVYKRGKEHPQYNSIELKCKICKKIFLRRPSEIKYGKNKNCSMQCYSKYRSIYLSRENHPSWKGYTKICLICKKPFHLKPSLSKLRVTCSMKCMGKLYITKLRKEKNPNWRNGISSISRRIRSSKRYRVWRKKVFERDNYTCQKCHKRGGYLHSHHIKSFIKYPKLRFKVSNGMTLCVKHHRKTYINSPSSN